MVTLLHPPVQSNLKITKRSFRHAAPRLWNKLPPSHRIPSHSSLIHIMDQSVTCLMAHFILVLKLTFSSSPFLPRSVSSFTHSSAGTFNCPLCGRIWRFKCRQVRQIKPAELALGRTIKQPIYLLTYLLTDKTPGHVRGSESSRYESHRPSRQRQQYDMCKFAFVTHWNCQGREVIFPHPPNRGRSVQGLRSTTT